MTKDSANSHADAGLEQLSLVDSLAQLSFFVQSVLGEVGTANELTVPQIRLLGILRDREASMQQLARHLGLDKSSITGLVQRAEQRGIVERFVAPGDRRSFLVRPTAAGRRLIETAGRDIERQLNAAAAALTEDERETFAALGTKIIQATARFRQAKSNSPD